MTTLITIKLADGEEMPLGRDSVGGDRRVSRCQATVKNIGGGILLLTQHGINKSIIVRNDREIPMEKGQDNIVIHDDVIHLHQSKECSVVLNIPEDEDECEQNIKRHKQEESYSPLSSMIWRLSTINPTHRLDNSGCVSLIELFKIPPKFILFADYMIDEVWLLSAFPYLKDKSNCSKVTLWLDSKGGGTMRVPHHWNVKGLRGYTQYGCHHSKLIIAGYPTGVRIVIHTANLLYGDVNCKTQGIWWQDFPIGIGDKKGFKSDLCNYLRQCDKESHVIEELQKINFNSATVDLIPSVPGRHTDNNISKYGHMRLRHLISKHLKSLSSDYTTILQCSSLGSLSQLWMTEFCNSLSTTLSDIKMIWPTVSEVRDSIEGYNAGACIPGTSTNVSKLNNIVGTFHKWGGTPRERAAPHIKTYTSICEETGKIDWSCLTSANLSGAAWGRLEKKSSQLYIMHYELGIIRINQSHCVDDDDVFSLPQGPPGVVIPSSGSLSLAGSSSEPHIGVPLPFAIPTIPYTKRDTPWRCDLPGMHPDSFGYHGPSGVSLYGIVQD